MEVFVFSIFDRVANVFNEPFTAHKPQLAIRKFRYMLQNSPMVAADCDLYCLGSFNTETGAITVYEKPEFVDRPESA